MTPEETEYAIRIREVNVAMQVRDALRSDSAATLGEKMLASVDFQQKAVGLAAFKRFHDLTPIPDIDK